MSRKGREIDDYLADILASIGEVEEFLQGLTMIRTAFHLV